MGSGFLSALTCWWNPKQIVNLILVVSPLFVYLSLSRTNSSQSTGQSLGKRATVDMQNCFNHFVYYIVLFISKITLLHDLMHFG